MKTHNKCTACIKHIMVTDDPREGKCADKQGYTTLNALKELYCLDFIPK